jgi:hypothetical protein
MIIGMRSSLRIPMVAVPVVALALLGAGCGGGGGGSSTQAMSASDWANGVCTAVSKWKTSVTSAVNSLKGGNLSQNTAKSAATSVEDATSTLESDLKNLGKPNTSSGDQAQKSVQTLSSDVSTGKSKIQSDVNGASGVSGLLAAASSATATLSTMSQQVQSTVSDLKALDPKGELGTAFDKSSACQSLKSSS